ncbi:MAG: SIS domain-containing protein, partial [Acetatifactor sp.]|nr:SIS domain-containing protein [Acetatifactor sp.]
MESSNRIWTELTEQYPALWECISEIKAVGNELCHCYDDGKKVLVCGNGGSAADSEHIVGELMKEFYIRRPLKQEEKDLFKNMGEDGETLAEHLQGALPAITLTGAIALSTAYANDAVPEMVFAQQVWGYGQKGDLLLAISTSGSSTNICYAIETAKAKKLRVVGLTGKTGGRMKELCDACICVPETVTYRIQEYHLPIYHALCRAVE